MDGAGDSRRLLEQLGVDLSSLLIKSSEASFIVVLLYFYFMVKKQMIQRVADSGNMLKIKWI